MQRRIFLRNSLLTLGALTIAQQNIVKAFNVDPWKITMLTKDLGIFTESGGTILFKFTTNGIIVVDSQFPASATHLIDELKTRNGEPITLLINTHHHGDHTSGNITFQPLTKRILAHKNSLINQKKTAETNKTESAQAYPNQTFDTLWSETIGKTLVSLHYFGAGHTNGDAIVHFPNDKVIHMGDLVFNRRFPFIDTSAGANIKSWIEVLGKTVSKFPKDTTYVCGHAGDGYPVVGKSDMLIAFKDYLTNALAFVGESIKSGKSKEDILKTTEIPGSPEWKGKGIERTLNAAIEELTKG